ncbi:DUF3983 domain-containing protein [Bacillus toyonensis]|uniref:DUF3983 domain-containing protein n=1 Tax=Bacillus toyonensis TaxID=155322 RepID=A0A2B5WTT0_9BACI|nr:DUF3983 domain-containing protein [Bacillus toyonensis]PGA91467.1 DUF3983 domain-containing protein [Bacillus toyonensis]PHD56331.1 DUF3983 domain-containing protein [Bacillus toyonensis]
MKNHKKRKIKKAIARRAKLVEKQRTDAAWINIFVKRGIL